jgi:MFS family permease
MEAEEKGYKESIFKATLLFIILNVVIAFFLYFLHISAQKDALFSAIRDKSKTIGVSVVNTIKNSINYGIPLKYINGGTKYLNERLKSAKELEYIAITDMHGEIIAKSDDFNDGENIKGYKESLKGKFKSFAKAQKLSTEEPRPFDAYFYHNIPLRIMVSDKVEGYVHVGISNRVIDSNIASIFYDIAFILLASLIIGYEFLNYVFRNTLIQPMRDFNQALRQVCSRDFSEVLSPRVKDSFGRALIYFNSNIFRLADAYDFLKARFSKIRNMNDHYDLIKHTIKELEIDFKMAPQKPSKLPIKPVVNNLRLVMFLVVFGEAIIIASIPSYTMQFYQSTFFISKSVLSALPIIINMAFTAIFIPLAPLISNKKGFRKSFMFGSTTLVCGYTIAFTMNSLVGLLLSRAITGIGFATCYVCCQNYAAAYSTEESRIHSYAIFSIASGAGFICGTPIGGILVDNIGYQALFFLSSLVGISCFAISREYIVDLPHTNQVFKLSLKNRVKNLFKIHDLVGLIIFSALPTRFLFSSVICFLYPLYLSSLGNSQSVIGRVMMLFGVITYALATHAPKLVTKVRNPSILAISCSCLIGIPMMLDSLFKTTESIVIQLSVNTICSIFYVSSLMFILDKISIRESKSYSKASILGFYFFFERIGMVIGPGLTSIILTQTDYSKTLFFIGAGLIISNLAYVAQMILANRRQKANEVKS